MLARPVDVFIRMWCTVSNTIIVASLIHDSSYFFLVAVCSSYLKKKLIPTFQKCFRFWGLCPPDAGLCPWTPLGDFRPPNPWSWTPVKNFQCRPCVRHPDPDLNPKPDPVGICSSKQWWCNIHTSLSLFQKCMQLNVIDNKHIVYLKTLQTNIWLCWNVRNVIHFWPVCSFHWQYWYCNNL